MYVQQGAKAEIDLQFDNMVKNGVYTLWCVTISMPTFEVTSEKPCGAPDGSENSFIADDTGHADIQMTTDAFPPSTDEVIYEIAVAYHSDGQTHGVTVGEYGRNAHVQLIYDFFPPE